MDSVSSVVQLDIRTSMSAQQLTKHVFFCGRMGHFRRMCRTAERAVNSNQSQ